jgi:hypothetical protein
MRELKQNNWYDLKTIYDFPPESGEPVSDSKWKTGENAEIRFVSIKNGDYDHLFIKGVN